MNNEPTKTPFGWLTRCFLKLAGMEPELLAKCPSRDADNAKMLAGLMVLVAFWQTGAITQTAHKISATPDVFYPPYLVAAALVATIVMALDSYLIMRPSWFAHGLRDLIRGGLNQDITTGDRIKIGAFVVTRLAFATNIGALLGIHMLTLFFAPDIVDARRKRVQSANASIVAEETARDETTMVAIAKDRDRLVKEHENVAATASDLQQILSGGSAVDPELAGLIERASEVAKAKAAADAALQAAHQQAANELGGIRSPDTSGKIGDGPLTRAARDRIKAAQSLAVAKSNELTSLHNRIDTLRKSGSAGRETLLADARARLPDVLSQKASIEARLKESDERRNTLIAERATRIDRAIKSHPLFAEESNGFLGQVRGLWSMASDPVIAVICIMVLSFTISLELAAVLGKLTVLTPTTYGKMLAAEEELNTQVVLARLERETAAVWEGRVGEERSPSAPSHVVVAEDDQQSSEYDSREDTLGHVSKEEKLEDATSERTEAASLPLEPVNEAFASLRPTVDARASSAVTTQNQVPETTSVPEPQSNRVMGDQASEEEEGMAKSEQALKRKYDSDIERQVIEKLAERAERDPLVNGLGQPAPRRGRGRPPGSPNKPKGPWVPKNASRTSAT